MGSQVCNGKEMCMLALCVCQILSLLNLFALTENEMFQIYLSSYKFNKNSSWVKENSLISASCWGKGSYILAPQSPLPGIRQLVNEHVCPALASQLACMWLWNTMAHMSLVWLNRVLGLSGLRNLGHVYRKPSITFPVAHGTSSCFSSN